MRRKGRRLALATSAIALIVLGLAIYLGWPHLVSWYRFRNLFESLGRNAQGYPEYRHRQTGIEMVLLPGGTFLMGAQRTDPKARNHDSNALPDEVPVHEVTLSPFLVGKYEVTQGEWIRVISSNPSRFTGDDNRPVENISWDDIQTFEAKTGLKLPTEAEWEYACRSGTTTPLAGTGKLDEMAWWEGNCGGMTHPVGQKRSNAFGLHDMYGNVHEICKDDYDENFYARPEASKIDAICRSGSSGAKVMRGGGLIWAPRGNISSSVRGAFMLPDRRSIGFRAVAPAP